MALSRIGKIVIVTSIIFGALVAAGVIAVVLLVPLSESTARDRFVTALSERLDAQVELKELRLRTWPTLRAEGRGLVIRHHGRTDVPPLITIAHFSAEGTVMSFLHRHVTRVDLEGLDIEIPPDRNRDAGETHEAKADDPTSFAHTLVVDHLYSMGAKLSIIPSEDGRPPRVWDIHDLHMMSVSAGQAMPFEATLTNAIPPGEITTRGSFGPWQADEPGETPLNAVFTFARADLSVFTGIAGILSARGQFGGKLERIDVHGETNTPDFRIVKTGGHPIPLHTKYHAIVDGTNGNTILDEVDASFLNTSLVAKGGVIGKPRVPGRTVTLDVTIDRGRIEDIMRLAVDAPKAPMVGALRLKTKFVLPPGDEDVVRKLRLDGRFGLMRTRFTSDTVQDKINELSHRGSGQVREKEIAKVSSKFDGRFALGRGTLEIPDVTFDVPGATVQLAGNYALEAETIGFQGTLFMDATVSETQTGVKRMLLKVVDPLFKRDGGGSAIPIRIQGTRNDPSFGLDKGRIFSHPRQR